MAIKGMDKHLRRLTAAKEAAQKAARGLYMAGQLIEAEAEHSITEGAVSGKYHVPSRPGQPPNEDTGALRSTIETRIVTQAANPTVEVSAGGGGVGYAAHLEYGTSKMAARPFMRPATEKHRADVARLVKEQVNITVRRG